MYFKSTPYIYILFFLLSTGVNFAQNYELKIEINSKEDHAELLTKSDGKNFTETDSIQKEIDLFLNNIQLKGYLNSKLDSLVTSDSLWTAYVYSGKRLDYINIEYNHIPRTLLSKSELQTLEGDLNENFIRIPFSNLSRYMESLVNLFETKGNSFVQFSLTDIKLDKNEARAKLYMDLNFQRHIDKIVVKGYENFPKTYLNHELDLKIGSLFNKNKIEKASKLINNLSFAQEVKPPEVLFTNDSTIIYLYLQRKKSNQFDGIIGFASKENDEGLEFNGYLDLSINNIFNSGETIALYWKNNGNDRQRFYLEAELPYLFNLPITPRVNFELYRQDSTFNNVKADVSLKYTLKNAGLISAHLNTESSNDLTNGDTPGINSYTNLFYGLSYSLKILRNDALFPVVFEVGLTGLIGSRDNDIETKTQSKFTLIANYLYSIDQKNSIFLQNNSGILNSENYFENELFRIGGINNLRGVNEESIFTSVYSIFNLEYRFRPNPTSYFYSITDFAYINNDLLADTTNVISFGLGYAFQTKAGVLNLSYALGKFDNEPFTFNDSKVHIKIVSKF